MASSMFAVAAPGLEPLVEEEVRRLGAARIRPLAGGIAFEGETPILWRANLELRTATRVLLRLGRVQARSLGELRRTVADLPWSDVVGPGARLRVDVTCQGSRVWHSGAAGQRIEQGAREALGPPGHGPEIHVVARIRGEHCSVSLDSSGEPLHRRSWRLEGAKAPLRETLAASLLAIAGYDGTEALVDPLCGSGTIPIEAALRAMGVPPGAKRRFAFMEWPSFDAAAWGRMRDAALASALPAPPAPIIGSDRDAGAVEAARRNAERAGVAAHITFERRAVSDSRAPAPRGLIACNPPYGGRIGGPGLRDLYAALGNLLRRDFGGWRMALLTSDRRLATATGLRLEGESAPIAHGGLRVHAYTFLANRPIPG